jgi:hypothetical protein
MHFIDRNAIHWADFTALWGIKMANALGAFAGVNFVDVDTLINGIVRAFWLAHVAIDALIGDFERHDVLLTDLGSEGCHCNRMDKIRHVAAEHSNFADDGGGDKHVFVGWC